MSRILAHIDPLSICMFLAAMPLSSVNLLLGSVALITTIAVNIVKIVNSINSKSKKEKDNE